MKLIKIFPLLLLMLLIFSSCSILDVPEVSTAGKQPCAELGEECTYGEWIEPVLTCTSGGVKKRICTKCASVEKVTLSPLGHDETVIEGRESTCKVKGVSEGLGCSRCDVIFVEQTELPLKEHVEETIPATENKTAGVRCSVCLDVLVAPEWLFSASVMDPSSYDSTSGYEYLDSFPNGSSMQALYRDIDAAADLYHIGEKSLGENNSIIEVRFADYGLTRDEAISVWASYKNDRPLYFWLANSIVYTSATIYVSVGAEYTDVNTVLDLNEQIYSAVQSYIVYADGAVNSYEIALALHDKIISSANYAYESDGTTPEDAVWAHNILGVLLEGAGVCESYAKAFQMLLNYWDVENCYVTGVSFGENHAWNSAKMDDGRWYWFDLTWDDVPDYRWGVTHNYFCVTDDENVGYRDGYIVAERSFIGTHTVNEAGNMGMEFIHPAPQISSVPYSSELFTKEEISVIDGATFKLAGYKTLSLIKAPEGETSYTIPETVTLGDVVYTVAYVTTNNGEDVFSAPLSSLHISKNVSFFNTPTPDTLIEILVDEANPYFELYEGAVYNENKTILYILCDKNAISFNIISSLVRIYQPRFIFEPCKNLSSFTIESGNEAFVFEGGILYEAESGALSWIPRKITGDVVIRQGVEEIGYNESFGAVFVNCHTLTSVTIPRSVKNIGSYAFAYCSSLSEVIYSGTRAEFEAIISSELWAVGSSFTVRCSDETFTVSE